MTAQIDFDCHEFLDNTNMAILEISFPEQTAGSRRYEWLLITKNNLSVRRMQLKTKDASSSIQERFFDLGFLKYSSQTGVFIESQAKESYPLEHKGCENIPKAYLNAVNMYLQEYLAA